MQFFRSLVLTLTIAMLMFTSCGTVKHQPTTNTQTTTIIKDSIRWKDSTVLVSIPVERYVDVVPAYDTLRLETTMAKSEAYVDTLTHTLKGNLEHKPEALKTTIKYKDHIVTVTKDSLVTKEVPVPVEVVREVTPKWAWYLVLMNIITVIALFVISYLRFKGRLKQ